MQIIRGDHESHFTIISNQVMRDDRLSFRARGVHHYLLSFPTGWRIDSSTIARAGKEGRDAIRTALNELQEAGYLTRIREQDAQGRWRQVVVITEIPAMTSEDSVDMRRVIRFAHDSTHADSQPPRPEKPNADNPVVGDSGLIRKNDEKNEKKNPLPVDAIIDHLADSWWLAYKHRTGGKTPVGKRAWFALRNVIRAALDAGWSPEDVEQALTRCETVPSASFFERALQGSGARRSAGEDRLRRDLDFLAKIAQSASEPPIRAIEQ